MVVEVGIVVGDVVDESKDVLVVDGSVEEIGDNDVADSFVVVLIGVVVDSTLDIVVVVEVSVIFI